MQNKTLNSFTLKHLIGKGGMAEVWYAQNKLGKPAAVKIMLQKFIGEEQVVSRFETEAKAMVQLNHPNIRQVFDLGEYEQRPFIVMEYLDGEDLSELIKHNKKPTESQLQLWWQQCTDALEFTHNKGIIHRDIKPSNLFLTKEGTIKILDFGIAKVKQEISITGTGQALGTILYMSPEQIIDPKRVTKATDYYSLAVSFVHLISGKSPFSETESQFKLQLQITNGEIDVSHLPDNWKNKLLSYLGGSSNDKTIVLNKKPFDDKTNIDLQKDDICIEGKKNSFKDKNSKFNMYWQINNEKVFFIIKSIIFTFFIFEYFYSNLYLLYENLFFYYIWGPAYHSVLLIVIRILFNLLYVFTFFNLVIQYKKNIEFYPLKIFNIITLTFFWLPLIMIAIYLDFHDYNMLIFSFILYFLTSELLGLKRWRTEINIENTKPIIYTLIIIINSTSILLTILFFFIRFL